MIHSDVIRDRKDFRHLLTFSHPVRCTATRGTIVPRLSIAPHRAMRVHLAPGHFDSSRVRVSWKFPRSSVFEDGNESRVASLVPVPGRERKEVTVAEQIR